MEEGDNLGNRLTHASMETTDVKPLMLMNRVSSDISIYRVSLYRQSGTKVDELPANVFAS